MIFGDMLAPFWLFDGCSGAGCIVWRLLAGCGSLQGMPRNLPEVAKPSRGSPEELQGIPGGSKEGPSTPDNSPRSLAGETQRGSWEPGSLPRLTDPRRGRRIL